jgi:hypothetical protein
MGIKLLPRSVSSQTETIYSIFWTVSIHTIKKRCRSIQYIKLRLSLFNDVCTSLRIIFCLGIRLGESRDSYLFVDP